MSRVIYSDLWDVYHKLITNVFSAYHYSQKNTMSTIAHPYTIIVDRFSGRSFRMRKLATSLMHYDPLLAYIAIRLLVEERHSGSGYYQPVRHFLSDVTRLHEPSFSYLSPLFKLLSY